ncbi:MAG: MarR family winged helix-turn-helix transcriptional regulator [Serpentinimonas sp.]|nr:MarR family winged helix-turn-helix transcriptional regulator [Serpentinimonas sp.]
MPRPARTEDRTAAALPAEHSPPESVDTSYLETLLGYNARRTALAVIAVFLQRMAPYGLRPVDFSVLSVVAHNPGVTSRQVCAALDIQPPNLVGMVKTFEQRGLIERRPHPSDRRAHGLHLTPQGLALQRQAEATASALESDVAARLSAAEQKTLISLLRRVYLPG